MSSLPLHVIIKEIEHANATRFCTAASVVILVYDNLLTFSDEWRYIWRAPSSFSKYACLVNRYATACVLLAIVNESCGFNGFSYSNRGCQGILISSLCLGTFSITAANMFVLHRVVALWKENRRMKIFLYGTYTLSVCVSLSLMTVASVTSWSGIRWSPVVNMCIATNISPSWGALWGAPLFFEVTILSSVIYNTLASPRSAQVPLIKALQNDGIAFFMTILILRLFNLIFALVAPPSLKLVVIFLMWALDTIVLNRFIIHQHQAEFKQIFHSELPTTDSSHLPGVELTSWMSNWT